MTRARSLGLAPLVAITIALGACGDGTGPKLAPLTVNDLLAELAETQAYGAAGGLVTGFAPVGPIPTASCAYDGADQRFVCIPITRDGFTTTRYYQFLDAAGSPQAEFNRTTTAAFRTVADVTGSTSTVIPPSEDDPGGTFTITVDSHEDQTLSGLLTGTHVLNGTATSSTTIEFGGDALAFVMQTTTTNLVLPRRGSSERYPRSGSIAMVIGIDGETITMTMTFNGTSKASVTITDGTTTQTCVFDLEDPGSEPVCTS